MSEERKRGALSREEMEYIAKNVDRFTVDEIAGSLNRHKEPVLRYIRRNKLGKKYAQEVEAGEKTDHMLLKELKQKAFYKNLLEQLTIAERDYFEEHWVSMVQQFSGDLLPSEEMELKELLVLEILKNREAAAEKARLDRKSELERDLARERKLDKAERDLDYMRGLQADITSLMASSSAYIKNFKDLCDRADKMRKALHASRQDRAQDLKNSKIDFISWLKMLEDYENKERVGKELAVLEAAKKAEQAKLGSYHTYANKEVAKPLFNEDTVDETE